MNIRKPLFWHQGQFLQPQHFQYVDAYHAAAAGALQRRISPHHWGVVDLDVNVDRLQSGVFELNGGTILFQDGTLAAFPDNATVSPRDFRAGWRDQRRPLKVYLGLRRLTPNDPNVTVVTDHDAAGRAATRYASLAEAEAVPDLYQGGSERAQLKTLTLVLRVFWEDELEEADQYDLVPVAQMDRDGDLVRLDPNYAPPTLTVGAVPVLTRVLKDIREEVIGRSRQLEEYKGGDEVTNPEYSPKVMRYRLALQVLSRYAPLFAQYVDTPQVHPWEAYGAIRQLIGEMSVFSRQVDVLGSREGTELLPSYDHTGLGHCYTAARGLVETLLNAITVGPELLVRLEQKTGGRFEADIPREFMDRRSDLYLVIRTEVPFEQLLGSFGSYAKLGAAEQVDVYVERALPGIRAEYLQVRPEALPHRPHASYFQIDRRDPSWEAVEGERALALLWDDAPDDLKVELVMVRR